MGHIDNNPEEEAPTATERGEPAGTEIQGWADDIMTWGHTNLVASLNADMVDGLHATGSSNPLPNTLLALGADGKFPASVIPPSLSSGLWTDAGQYIYPNNAGSSFQIMDTGSLRIIDNTYTGPMEPGNKLQINFNGIGALFKSGDDKNRIGFDISNNNGGVINLYNTTGDAMAVRISGYSDMPSYFNASNVGIGTTAASEKLDVAGTIKLTGLKMPTGAVNGYVMTSDVNGAGTWQPAANGGPIVVPDNTISQAKLKTAVGEVAVSDGPVTLPGGEYGFYPQVKGVWFADSYGRGISIVGKSGSAINIPSYTTVISQSGAFGTNYVKQRYVTSSGEDYWIFLLLNNSTKNVIASYAAPDHPAYGNGGDFIKLPHPFDSYDKIKHEIIIVDKRTVDQLKQEGKLTGRSIITLVSEEYKPDMDSEEQYQPLHSGKYLTSDGNQVKELVTALPDYIKVRKLIKLTDQETQQRSIVSQERRKEIEQVMQKKEQAKISAINKLQGLGLSEDEIEALIGK